MIQKTFYLNSFFNKTKKLNDNLQIEGYANTSTKDRQGDIIVPSAWVKGVDSFRKNPILLWNHDSNKPIGRVTNMKVDGKGLFIEANISSAAEKQYSIWKLIEDEVLKSFSVGFIVKDQKYDSHSDSSTITDVELLEISVVSIPANQESLFSLKKSFSNENEYKTFLKSFSEVNKKSALFVGTSSLDAGHYHALELDEDGVGRTTFTSHGHTPHIHEIINKTLQPKDDHVHFIRLLDILTNLEDYPLGEMPLIEEETPKGIISEDKKEVDEKRANIELNSKGKSFASSLISNDKINKLDSWSFSAEDGNKLLGSNGDDWENYGKHFLAIDSSTENKTKEHWKFPFAKDDTIFRSGLIAIRQRSGQQGDTNIFDAAGELLSKIDEDNKENTTPSKMLLEDIQEKKLLNVEKTIQKENSEGLSKDLKNSDGLAIGKIVKYNNRKWKIKEIPSEYSSIFQLKEIDENGLELEEILNLQITEIELNEEIEPYIFKEQSKDTIQENLVGVSEKTLDNEVIKLSEEKNKMAGKTVLEPLTVKDPEKDPKSAVEIVPSEIQVSAPKVEELINKTGAKASEVAAAEMISAKDLEELRVLKSEMNKYKDQIAAMQNEKMVYAQQNQKSQFTPEQMADAYLLCKGYAGKEGYFGDGERLFDYTKFGKKVKAVTTVDAFLSNFTSVISKELQQELVIAPLLQRITVDAKNFRIPVSDEDESGAVAQFPSGTYATGIGDTTNVPTSAQNTLKSVTLSPVKFMSTVHLPKDEEEDTVLAILPFLREGAMRRTARAIDKSLLRGDATLSTFGASPTNFAAGTGYQSAIRGIATHCFNAGAQTLVVNTGVSTQATPTNIASARAKLGKYGLRVGNNDLVYLTSVEGYNELVQTADFRTVDTFGPQATYHTGTLGAIWGIPVMITEFLDNKGSSGNWVGLLMYRPGFKIGEIRGLLVESEYQPRQQVTAIYISTRLDMKPLTTNASGQLDSTYPMATLLVSSA